MEFEVESPDGTNAKSKLITEQIKIADFGEVWFDNDALSKLLGLNDVISRGHRVTCDSDVTNQVIVYVRDEQKMCRGKYYCQQTPVVFMERKNVGDDNHTRGAR